MVSNLIYFQKFPFIGFFCHWILVYIYHCDIPRTVKVPRRLYVAHHGHGICLHPRTEIAKGVRIFQDVTIGRADVYLPSNLSDMEKVIIDEFAILGAGSKILCSHGVLRIGKDAIVAANSVVTKDIPDYEVWGGVPAKKLYTREKETIFHGKAK